MELLYIWFHDYGPFRKQGFQLSAEFRFEFEWDEATLTEGGMVAGTLIVASNPEFVPDYFDVPMKKEKFLDPDRAVITNITAIVGENGAGKTRFLDYVKNVLVRAQGQDVRNALIVLRNEQGEAEILYDHTVIHLRDVRGHESLPIKRKQGKTDSNQRLPNSSVLFLSNLYDHSYEGSVTNYYNLSTNYLIRADKARRIEDGTAAIEQPETEVHRDEDVSRQVILVHDYPERFDEPLPVRVPDRLVVKLRPIGATDEKQLGRFAPFFSRIYTFVEGKLTAEREPAQRRPTVDVLLRIRKNLFIYQAYRTLLWTFLKEMSAFPDDHLMEADDEWLQRSLPEKASITVYKNFIRTFLQAMLNRAKAKSRDDVEWLRQVSEMPNLFDRFAGRSSQWTDPVFSIPIRRENVMASESYEFVKTYRGSYRFYAYLDFEWPLSSGEKAMLNVFSRLYTIADGQPAGDNLRLTNNVLLLIDEGDLYLHPEWQRRFIDRLIRFLSVAYAKRRRIQIILTSHSPFLLSDVPASCVNYLQREEERTVVSDGLSRKKRTFAANIHDLFSMGFFMSSTVGEFAKNKITEVIDMLKEMEQRQEERQREGLPYEAPNKEDLDSAFRVIRLIGEPLIYGRLLDMYNNLLPDRRQEEHARRQLEYWRGELARLEGKQADRHD